MTFKDRYANAALDAPVYAVQNAEDIIIAVIGGAGKHSAYIPTFGATKAVTRALKRAGRPAREIGGRPAAASVSCQARWIEDG